MFTLNLSFNPLYVRLTEHYHHNALSKQRTLYGMRIPTYMHALEFFWRFLQGCSLSHSECTLLLPQSADASAHTADQEYVIFDMYCMSCLCKTPTLPLHQCDLPPSWLTYISSFRCRVH